MSIIIGADFVPTTINQDLFNGGNFESLVGPELYEIIASAQFRVFNLEMPIYDGYSPIGKNGPVLKAPTSSINMYRAAKVDLFTLANNHIFDHGIDGLESTIQCLDDSGIAHIGAGLSENELSVPYYYCLDDKYIGFYACAEHEFSVYEGLKYGANPTDSFRDYSQVQKTKKKCDYLVVLYHGGKEHYRYPSPRLQQRLRAFIDFGADLVIAQHSHCVGCQENYKKGTIIYGQGNFVFNYLNNDFWKTGVLVKILPSLKLEFISYEQVENGIRKKEGSEIIDGFHARSEQIKTEGFVESNYKEFAKGNIDSYLNCFSGNRNSRVVRILDRMTKGKFHKYLFSKKYGLNDYYSMINYLKCESHLELVEQGLWEIVTSQKEELGD